MPRDSTSARNGSSLTAVYQDAVVVYPALWQSCKAGKARFCSSCNRAQNFCWARVRCSTELCLSGSTLAMRFLLLIHLPLLTQILVIEVNVGIDGGLDLGMSQALLYIASIPPSANEFGGMTVAQQVSMQRNPTFATVMAKQAFKGLTREGMTIGGSAPPIP